jgi:hypothetical protein
VLAATTTDARATLDILAGSATSTSTAVVAVPRQARGGDESEKSLLPSEASYSVWPAFREALCEPLGRFCLCSVQW